MTEDEEKDLSPITLKKRIDELQWLITVMIGTLSEDQVGYIKYRLAEHSRNTQDSVWRRNTDPARDDAAMAYELEHYIINWAEDSAGGYAIYLEK
ncbi:hypothetical protein G6L86_02445 [Agrobacterium tumefaciens]|uniref:hypothetical protein n=1 Tax=Agrobacterium tumefaciens TaxID=358 RepID=UPI001574ED06|nr:hypothetical protein [Agrobacterium tumefaciens]NSX84436.1 hypothetical protein [Agrobacterium tumefaciens]